MSGVVATSAAQAMPGWVKRALKIAIPVVIVAAMVWGTDFVSDRTAQASGPQQFSAADYGKKNFPRVQSAIEKRAAGADILATALKANQSAAVSKYGVTVSGAAGPELCVRLTGVVGSGAGGGIYPVTVPGIPKSLQIRVQTGPAIDGTDLRDAAGFITFGQFTNQIDYQNAASALNSELKREVLAKIDTTTLTGKTITVVGAFQLINPDGWLVTPATVTVK